MYILLKPSNKHTSNNHPETIYSHADNGDTSKRMSLFALIFRFCRKWQKCQISEECSAKLPSAPSNTIAFSTDFSSNFHVFPNPLPEGNFGRSKRRPMPTSLIWGRLLGPRGDSKTTLGAQFSAPKLINFPFKSKISTVNSEVRLVSNSK